MLGSHGLESWCHLCWGRVLARPLVEGVTKAPVVLLRLTDVSRSQAVELVAQVLDLDVQVPDHLRPLLFLLDGPGQRLDG